METEIFELIQKIRGHINRTEKMASLLPDNSKWLPLTSALDVLEDSSGAVNYYIESTFPENVNGKYLFIYMDLFKLCFYRWMQQIAFKRP